MNIHLRACPRCGGDVDAALRDDVRCVQCGHRIHEPAAAGSAGILLAFPDPRGRGLPRSRCPRCRSVDLVALDRLSPDHNLCFRCRLCGHIFSPAAA